MLKNKAIKEPCLLLCDVGKLDAEDITSLIIGCAIEVHKELGPGLLESSYETCLFHEIIKAGLEAKRQVPLPVVYDTIFLETGYRMDILVANKIIVEVKAVEKLADVHIAQILTYLKFSGNKIGLLINFNVLKLKDGLKRISPRR